jgi:hypothetical protein
VLKYLVKSFIYIFIYGSLNDAVISSKQTSIVSNAKPFNE